MKSIYIMRHGQTEYNLKGVLQGRAIDASLNETGRKQASAFYHAYKNENFDLVISSSLKRSRESIQAFIDHGVDHLIDDRITEFSWGENEGMPLNELVVDRYRKMLQSWYDGLLEARIPEGESGEELFDRVHSFVQYLKKLNSNKILICTHGRTLKMLIVVMLEWKLQKMENVPHSNSALYQLLYNGERFKLVKENDISHLPAELQYNVYWDK